MKRTIAMTEKELRRKTVVEQAEDKRISQKEGAEKLGISERSFRRLLSRHRHRGDESLISGHRGKPSNHRMKEEKREAILKFMGNPIFDGFGPTLLKEKLEEYKGIVICKESMRQMMIEEGKYQPKTKEKKEKHPERERRYRRGELVQIDGSYHSWLESRGPKGCLLLFVDDATSEVLAAEFVDHESFFAYARLCKSYFRSSGLPVAFYSDRFSVFRANQRPVSKRMPSLNLIVLWMVWVSSLSVPILRKPKAASSVPTRPSRIDWSRNYACSKSILTVKPMPIYLSLSNSTIASSQSCLVLPVMFMFPWTRPWTWSSFFPSMTFALSRRIFRSNSTMSSTRSLQTDLSSIFSVVRCWSCRMQLVPFLLTSITSCSPLMCFINNPNASWMSLQNPWITLLILPPRIIPGDLMARSSMALLSS
jgi:transposase